MMTSRILTISIFLFFISIYVAITVLIAVRLIRTGIAQLTGASDPKKVFIEPQPIAKTLSWRKRNECESELGVNR